MDSRPCLVTTTWLLRPSLSVTSCYGLFLEGLRDKMANSVGMGNRRRLIWDFEGP